MNIVVSELEKLKFYKNRYYKMLDEKFDVNFIFLRFLCVHIEGDLWFCLTCGI